MQGTFSSQAAKLERLALERKYQKLTPSAFPGKAVGPFGGGMRVKIEEQSPSEDSSGTCDCEGSPEVFARESGEDRGKTAKFGPGDGVLLRQWGWGEPYWGGMGTIPVELGMGYTHSHTSEALAGS